MTKKINMHVANTDRPSSPSGQSIVDASDTREASLRQDRYILPTTPPALAALNPKATDCSRFTNKTQPSSSPTGLKSTKFLSRKPEGNLFFRTALDEGSHKIVGLLDHNGKLFVVGEKVTRDAELEKMIARALITPYINERDEAFVLIVPEGFASVGMMALKARDRWLRVKRDDLTGEYGMEDASAYPELMASEPNWPLPPSAILENALTCSTITRDDDPVLLDILNKRRSRRTA